MIFESKSKAKPDLFAPSESLIAFYTIHVNKLYRVDLSSGKLRMKAFAAKLPPSITQIAANSQRYLYAF